MIEINYKNMTYVCPFCGKGQAYSNSHTTNNIGKYAGHIRQKIVGHRNFDEIPQHHKDSALEFYSFECNNTECNKICITARNRINGVQFDILPEVTYKHFPEYIPLQIRNDYEEACKIIEKSPKASATLLRRCLQGMIRDFWGVKADSLFNEITEIKEKVTPSQWKAIDGLRKIGNIGAHMEKDVNLIVDVDVSEAEKILKLIELLLEKWYIARYEEEELYSSITDISDVKQEKRKNDQRN